MQSGEPSLSCFARGVPAPKGSKRAFTTKEGRAFVVDNDPRGLRRWEATVRQALEWNWKGAAPIEGPVAVELGFVMLKPRSVPKKRLYPTVAPDSDKLARAALDCMTGIVFRDDAQVVRLSVSKDYGVQSGVKIAVHAIG